MYLVGSVNPQVVVVAVSFVSPINFCPNPSHSEHPPGNMAHSQELRALRPFNLTLILGRVSGSPRQTSRKPLYQ